MIEDRKSTVEPSVDMPRGQRILITGGTGFIGTALTDRLCGDNEVVMFDRQLSRSSWTLSGHNGHRNGSATSSTPRHWLAPWRASTA